MKFYEPNDHCLQYFFILFTFRKDVNPEENKLKTDDVTEEISNGKIEEVTTM